MIRVLCRRVSAATADLIMRFIMWEVRRNAARVNADDLDTFSR